MSEVELTMNCNVGGASVPRLFAPKNAKVGALRLLPNYRSLSGVVIVDAPLAPALPELTQNNAVRFLEANHFPRHYVGGEERQPRGEFARPAVDRDSQWNCRY